MRYIAALRAWTAALRVMSSRAAVLGFGSGFAVLLYLFLRSDRDSSDAYILIFIPMGIALISMYACFVFFGIATGENLRKLKSMNRSTDDVIDRALVLPRRRLAAVAFEVARVATSLLVGYIPLTPIIAIFLFLGTD